MKKILTLLSVTIFLTNITLSSNQNQQIEILFIGSSYFNYHNLPLIVENIATASGKDVYIDYYMPSGFFLADHVNNRTTLEKINERDWECVVLQGVGSLVAYPDYYQDNPIFPALQSLKQKIVSNYHNTKVIFSMPWAFEDGMTWLGWDDTFADMQRHIYNNTLNESDEIGFMIAPVGWAWYSVLKELNYPLHYLHDPDWNHPSAKGSYLMACTIYCTIFQESCENIQYNFMVEAEEALYFRRIASEIVLDDIDLWNIEDIILDVNELDDNNIKINVSPNPCHEKLTISYSLSEKKNIKSFITDLTGKIFWLRDDKNIINRKITINLKDLKAGVYFYVVMSQKGLIVKKIIKL